MRGEIASWSVHVPPERDLGAGCDVTKLESRAAGNDAVPVVWPEVPQSPPFTRSRRLKRPVSFSSWLRLDSLRLQGRQFEHAVAELQRPVSEAERSADGHDLALLEPAYGCSLIGAQLAAGHLSGAPQRYGRAETTFTDRRDRTRYGQCGSLVACPGIDRVGLVGGPVPPGRCQAWPLAPRWVSNRCRVRW